LDGTSRFIRLTFGPWAEEGEEEEETLHMHFPGSVLEESGEGRKRHHVDVKDFWSRDGELVLVEDGRRDWERGVSYIGPEAADLDITS